MHLTGSHSENSNKHLHMLEWPCTVYITGSISRWQGNCLSSSATLLLHIYFNTCLPFHDKSPCLHLCFHAKKKKDKWWKKNSQKTFLLTHTCITKIIWFCIPNEKVLKQEAHGPHRSPEKTVQSINTYDYIITLIKRRKKTFYLYEN